MKMLNQIALYVQLVAIGSFITVEGYFLAACFTFLAVGNLIFHQPEMRMK